MHFSLDLYVYMFTKNKSIVAPIFLHISANMFSLILSAFSTGVSENTTVDVSQVDMIITFIVMTVITGVITLFIGIIINKIVNPKESI